MLWLRLWPQHLPLSATEWMMKPDLWLDDDTRLVIGCWWRVLLGFLLLSLLINYRPSIVFSLFYVTNAWQCVWCTPQRTSEAQCKQDATYSCALYVPQLCQSQLYKFACLVLVVIDTGPAACMVQRVVSQCWTEAVRNTWRTSWLQAAEVTLLMTSLTLP